MKVKEVFSDKIIAINHAYSSFVDDDYFIDKLGEEKNDQDVYSYAVRVTCLEIDWILKDDKFGYRFLKRIYDSTNLELYNVEAVMILIEFLFEKYKKKAIKWRAPLYLAQIATFLFTAHFNEELHSLKKDIERNRALEFELKDHTNVTFSGTHSEDLTQ